VKTPEWDAHFFVRSPAYEPFLPLCGLIKAFKNWPAFKDLNTLKQMMQTDIATCSGMSVQFVPQISEGKNSGHSGNTAVRQYENRIYLTGEVPTRQENWHDFFNALVWLIFPRAKAALNHIHFQSLYYNSQNKNEKRGPLRDAATLFDESGVIVLSSRPEWIALLRQHEWKTVFWQHRAPVLASMRFILFGHALYEKMLNPYAGITGKGVFFEVEEAFLQKPQADQLRMIDRWLADFLLHTLSFTTDFSPIPILGYPGWTDDNANSDYYDNQHYFRPLARKK
jgi:Protein of unknown function (DUF3025)